MRYISSLMISFSLALSIPSFATNQGGTPEDARTLVKKAIKHFHTHGKDSTMTALNDLNGNFIDRDLYVSVHNDSGIFYALAEKPRFIGKNLSHLRGAKGKFFVKAQIDALRTANTTWQEYYWVNPINRKIQLKKSYCEKVGSLHFCSSAYVN